MKTFLIYSIICLSSIIMYNCNDSVNSDEIVQLGMGEYYGKIDVTLYSDSIFKSGEIYIEFFDKSYDYTAIITHSSKAISDSTITNHGWYEIKNDTISMIDLTFVSTSPIYQCIEFMGDYKISYQNDKICLAEINYYGEWDIRLQNK